MDLTVLSDEIPDLVACPLSEAVAKLAQQKLKYNIEYTKPDRSAFSLEEGNYYVIRQLVDDDGRHHLTAAAKMGKEV